MAMHQHHDFSLRLGELTLGDAGSNGPQYVIMPVASCSAQSFAKTLQRTNLSSVPLYRVRDTMCLFWFQADSATDQGTALVRADMLLVSRTVCELITD